MAKMRMYSGGYNLAACRYFFVDKLTRLTREPHCISLI